MEVKFSSSRRANERMPRQDQGGPFRKRWAGGGAPAPGRREPFPAWNVFARQLRGAGALSGRWMAGLVAGVLTVLAGARAQAQSIEDLRQMSIEQLANIDVSSVTRTPQALSGAPAAVYVITRDEIARSGALTLPEILRLAPNLEVFQTSASQYVVTARGFNGNSADQSFSNKLLVLVDGRSVYSPLYSGVYWDMQDVPPQDIERIEVISGPGATLWGANAVNGVINIITRKAADTQGGLVDVEAGDYENSVTVRYGGRIGDDLAYRLYVRDVIDADTPTAAGASAHDHWSKPQGGFRLDWTPTAVDTVTLQGDAYAGSEAQQGAPDELIDGRNLTARWTRALDGGGSLQVEAYYDHAGRQTLDGGGRFWVDTYDLEMQHSFALGTRNQIVWGGGLRFSRYDIQGPPDLRFSPPGRTLDLSDVFVQDSLAMTRSLTLILGLKLEDDPYSGISPLPSARLSWRPTSQLMLWAAASRAVRSPTPFDRDVVEKQNQLVLLVGGADFRPETLTAYEVGARLQPTPRLSFSVSTYYNAYDDLRSLEYAPVTYIPLRWGNMLRGDTYGLEAWADYRVAAWWRLSAGFDALREQFAFKPGSSGLLGVEQLGDDPRQQANLKSSMNLGHGVTLDGDLKYVDALPDPSLPAYFEFNARLGWKVSSRVQLSVSGFNLLHDRHQELPGALPVPRSFVVGLQWGF